ncbi:DUF222 domain-containing protein [Gordonia sp. NB41Y]|uniref:DUF222 domain-containing protein n=1 Tax=Gordonia sp. NB41Y TaxID=875808 RepID=UPI00273BFD73|nr:DUF222 domain-containing protein [Gordonia sp. NB41Y]WLP91715.1 DUF222 domain-containing protein [Gordonia sp. NB41Y]
MTNTPTTSLSFTDSRWPQLPHDNADLLGGVDPKTPEQSSTNDLLIGLREIDRGRSFLAWSTYRSVMELIGRHVDADRGVAGAPSGFVDLAKKISRVRGITQRAAELLMDESIAVLHHLPHVAEVLRDGWITPELMKVVVSRTALVHGRESAPKVDAEIAELIRRRRRLWSKKTITDMADRVVFRHDRDAVREARERCLDKRGVWTSFSTDGTGEIAGTMAADRVELCSLVIGALANTVCPHDGRSSQNRKSDAMFALLSGTQFECECGREDCPAEIPEAGSIPKVQYVIHLLANEATVADLDTVTGRPQPRPAPATPEPDPEVHSDNSSETPLDLGAPATGATERDAAAEAVESVEAEPAGIDTPANPVVTPDVASTGSSDLPAGAAPGYLFGKGVIAPEFVRDLASHPNARFTRLVPRGVRPEDVVLPPTLPSDPYRPSAALDEYVRLSYATCADVACTRSSFDADLDHVTEYDHHNPAAGGQTTPIGLNPKCRFDHLHKTHSEWVDDQHRDPHTSRLIIEYTTPEGLILPGPAETMEDFFPGLRRYRFDDPPQAPPTPPGPPGPPGAYLKPDGERILDRESTLARKHRRRRLERQRNRARNQTPATQTDSPDPPF